jgi:hypothetical protein
VDVRRLADGPWARDGHFAFQQCARKTLSGDLVLKHGVLQKGRLLVGQLGGLSKIFGLDFRDDASHFDILFRETR